MLLQDVAYTIRSLRKAPGFTVVGVLTLALGIGATSSLFSVIRGVLLRPLPFPAPEQIVQVHTLAAGEERSSRDLSPPNFASLAAESRTFAALSAVLAGNRTLSGAGEPISVPGAQVSAAFFDVMGVRPFLGRPFRPEENEPGNSRVAVLSHGLWQRVLGSDPAVLGRSITLDGVAHTVVGVMPPDFSFPDESELWIALEYGSRYSPTTTDGRYQNTWVPVLGRLHDGIGLERGRAELRAIGERLASVFPESNTGTSFTATPLREEIVADARTPLLLLFGAVSLVLLVACANLAGLQLVRGAARRGEMTVRAALGAGRPRLIRQLVTESVVLGMLGGGAGLLVAVWATNALVALRPEGIPRLESIGVDGVVLAFTTLVAIGVGLLSGVVPALRATESLAGTLRVTGRGSISQGNRLRSGIVVAQTALAVVLLIGAGLLLRSFARLIAVDPGFRYESVLAFRVALPAAEYEDESAHPFYERLVGTLEESPGVQAAGAVNRLPISQGSFDTRFSVEGRPDPNDAQESIGVLSVTPGYFSAFGIPVVLGRGISATDRSDSPAIVVINEAAVRRFFPDGADPIGRRLGRFAYDPIEEAADWFVIVGVVADARGEALSEAAEPEAFFAHAQVPLPTMQVVVRSAGDPAASGEAIRNAVATLDPRLPAPEIRSMERVVADSVARPRFVTLLLTLFAAVALTLSAVGIFGLLSYSVARRTSEIGVRIALGARPREIVLQIVRHALGLAGIGIACGVAGAIALTRVLQTQLFGIGTMDVATYALVILLLAVTALLSALIPARRAAAVDPIIALRQD